LPLPEKLVAVQALMKDGHPEAEKIFKTIGAYFGYAVAHYCSFYDVENIMILGRVTSGSGGEIILNQAKLVLEVEFPQFASKLSFSTPNEKDKRHGQAIAAASLPKVK
jgi:predicted NBD/HSP70 family sugar kinase